MGKDRLAAFSDGVIAIIVTIMVLELKPPQGVDLRALRALLPGFHSYAMSFLYVAIYWNNHHHMLHTVRRVNGQILWANMHLLFWLSLIPLAAAWMGQHYFAPLPIAIYGVALLMPAIAYTLLQTVIIRAQGDKSILAKAVGRDVKGRTSLVLYALAIGFAYIAPVVSHLTFAVVAAMWLVPDRRIARVVND